MSASGSSWRSQAALRIHISNLPYQYERKALEEMLSQYEYSEINCSPCSADVSFKNEENLLVALNSLQRGARLFGRSLKVRRFSTETPQIPFPLIFPTPVQPMALPFIYPPPVPDSHPYPPYNDKIGAHILEYASKRPDFYHSILTSMKTMGIPPPSALFDNQTVSNPTNGSTTPSLEDIPPGSRLKRNQPDLPSSDTSRESNPPNGCDESPEPKRRADVKTLASDITAEEEHQIDTPIQPLHFDLSHSSRQKSSEKTILNIIFGENTKEKEEKPRNEKPIEIVPFDTHALANAQDTSPLVKNFISEAELNDNRMTIEQIKSNPRFQDWEPGVPSSKLFVKNLPSKLMETDLARIFGRFSRSGLGDDVSIRLMTRGKMHGQAFVTFPDQEMAQKALDEVLGFLIHDRPMILVFGKNSDSK